MLSGSEIEKISLPFFVSENPQKGFLNVEPLKNFIELCMKESCHSKKENISEKDMMYISRGKTENLRIGVEFCCIAYRDITKIENCKIDNEDEIYHYMKGLKNGGILESFSSCSQILYYSNEEKTKCQVSKKYMFVSKNACGNVRGHHLF